MRWIQGSEDFSSKFKRLAGVNLLDTRQCTQELFPCLRFSKGLIDFYLEHLVFPMEMKEFSNKLSSSGWEIAREKRHPTTGFSGTNDSKVSQFLEATILPHLQWRLVDPPSLISETWRMHKHRMIYKSWHVLSSATNSKTFLVCAAHSNQTVRPAGAIIHQC
jgi:hypothetical protein